MAKNDPVFPAYRRGDKLTKKYTMPRPFQEKLVTVFNPETKEKECVRRSIAEKRVQSGTWVFVPKKENSDSPRIN